MSRTVRKIAFITVMGLTVLINIAVLVLYILKWDITIPIAYGYIVLECAITSIVVILINMLLCKMFKKKLGSRRRNMALFFYMLISLLNLIAYIVAICYVFFEVTIAPFKIFLVVLLLILMISSLYYMCKMAVFIDGELAKD